MIRILGGLNRGNDHAVRLREHIYTKRSLATRLINVVKNKPLAPRLTSIYWVFYKLKQIRKHKIFINNHLLSPPGSKANTCNYNINLMITQIKDTLVTEQPPMIDMYYYNMTLIDAQIRTETESLAQTL